MAEAIKPLPPYLLLVPVGGKFEDGQFIFESKRADFNECMLMYKPDYFFGRYQDSSDALVEIIKKKFNRFSSFRWDELFTLDINQRIESQKKFLKIIDEHDNNDTIGTTTTEVTAKIQEFKVTDKKKLLEKIGKCRTLSDATPWLISYQRTHKGEERNFVWLIVRVYDYELPKLGASQQYNELFYLLNHFYSAGVDPRIQLSMDFNNAKVDINTTSVAVPNSTHGKAQSYSEIRETTEPTTVYPAQKKVGEDIFKKITNRIPDFENRYDKFEVHLLLPPRKSLRSQSLARMRTVLTEGEREYLRTTDNGISSVVYLINSTNEDRYTSNVIKKAINPENKRTMYLIIQDECHWGMKLHSQADKNFVNEKTLLDENQSNNIYFLQVSATPYNIEAITDFRRDNIIRWDDAVKDLGPSNYKGRAELIQENKIRSQSAESMKCKIDFENYYSTIAYLSTNKVGSSVSLPELSIVCEYIITLHYILASMQNEGYENFFTSKLKQFVTDETKEILKGLCDVDVDGKGCLAVLRLNNTETGKKLKKWLQQLLKIYKQPYLFDIVVDVDDDENCLYDRLSIASQRKYKTWCNKVNELTPEEKMDFGYDNLKYLPLLLIVIEKGRMGDTFPSESFRYFDLRARYQGDALYSTYYCSLLQDVGRSFGYQNPENGRPVVFIGVEIFSLLNQNKLDPDKTLKKRRADVANTNPLTAADAENTNPLTTADTEDTYPLTTADVENTYPLTTVDAIQPGYPNNIYVDLEQHWMPNEYHPFGPAAEVPKQEAHKNVAYRRFLLSAHPQIGKTASFLWAVHLFVEHFSKPEHQKATKMQSSFCKVLYEFRNQDSNKLHTSLNDKENSDRWDQFHSNAERVYSIWQDEPNEIVPIEHCKTVIEGLTEKFTGNDKVIIIDMGCGLAKLAQHFRSNDKIKVINIDHRRHPSVPTDIHVLEMDMKSVTLDRIGNEFANFVVFSLSLWGTEENVTSYIQTATDLLKLGGRMIIIDTKNNRTGHKNLEDHVISILHETKKLSHKKSTKFQESRFFCILATREEEEDY